MVNVARLAKAIALSVTLIGTAASADTLSDVKARGGLRCGVHIEKPGFATADAAGRINGFDADFCRGIAAALGVEARFTALAPAQRFTALTSGAVDILLMTTTQTMQRDTTLGVEFPFINFYGGGMLITRKSLNVTSARQLDGATICLNQGTTADLFIADFFRLNKITYKQVMFERLEDGLRGYVEGRCDVFTQDDTTLAAMKAAMKDPNEHLILPEILSKEPVGAVTRNNDPRFSAIVRWVFAALVNAEEKGVTQANVDDAAANSPDPDVQRILGKTGKLGADVGLSPNWAALAIKSVGNYGEIFDRHLGQQSRFKMERGVNNLWSRGGLIYGLPIR